MFSQFGSQRLPDLRIGLIKLPIAAKLPLFGATDAVFEQPRRQLRQQLFAVMGPVRATQLVLGDVAADEPVAKRQADIDGAARLGGQFLVDAADRENKVLEC